MEVNDKTYTALIMEADVISDNGTLYTPEAVKKAVERMKQEIEKGQLYGELDHPYQNDFRIGFVSLERLAVQWVDVWMEGNKVYGKFRILPTPYGNLVKSLLENGINFGFSLRGSGKTKVGYRQQKRVEIVDDFFITAVDVVAVPSFQGARVLQESRFGTKQSLQILETVEKTLYRYL